MSNAGPERGSITEVDVGVCKMLSVGDGSSWNARAILEYVLFSLIAFAGSYYADTLAAKASMEYSGCTPWKSIPFDAWRAVPKKRTLSTAVLHGLA